MHAPTGAGEHGQVRQPVAVLVVHATKKLRDRLRGAAAHQGEPSTTALGDWYATVLFWRPQLALFVNEATLLPVLVALAPSATLLGRFVPALGTLLSAHGSSPDFAPAEAKEMAEWRLANTTNRSVVGIMNEFTFLAGAYAPDGGALDLFELSLRLAKTPCGPLYKRNVSPDRELAALLSGLGPH
ncbi:MAG TPA: hypothetical protein VEJ84_12895 [Acidimicrobiales bacterium]|nr:hypothetical protein [Acidimicrobiales bacterium]